MASKAPAIWLPQVMFESALIVVSILVALGLDEWREKREDAELVRNALATFLIEIEQNRLRVDDAAPFNLGLHQVMSSHYRENDIETVDEFVSMVESFSPAALHATAWDTALATGSLAKMEYTVVTALSLTYSLQERYRMATQSGVNNLTSPQNLSDDKLKLAVYNSIRYLDSVTTLETELSITYKEATSVIQLAQDKLAGELVEIVQPSVEDLARP
jgi:hypothetical protein